MDSTKHIKIRSAEWKSKNQKPAGKLKTSEQLIIFVRPRVKRSLKKILQIMRNNHKSIEVNCKDLADAFVLILTNNDFGVENYKE